MKLIIQIPAYNEEATIAKTLADLPRRVDGISTIETLLIDDGSSDRTVEAARRAGVTHVVRLLSHRGLSTAFVAGIDAALRLGADIIVNTDGDNQYRGADVAKLVQPIVAGKAEVVIGDRDVAASPHMGGSKRLLQRLGSAAVRLASGTRVADVTSGFRAFSRDAASQINVFNPFTYTLETIIQAGNRNLSVESVKVTTNPPTRPSRLYHGTLSYVRKSAATIFRIYTLYKPLKTFFIIGALLFAAGFILGLRFLYYFFAEGSEGHVQSLILAAVLLILGFQTGLIGLVADLISVNRRLSEEILIRMRKRDEQAAPQRTRVHREQRPMPSRRRQEPRERPQTPPSQPAKPMEPQWVWLLDESKLDPQQQTGKRAEPVAADREPVVEGGAAPAVRKRRRRRRGAGRPAAPVAAGGETPAAAEGEFDDGYDDAE